MKTDWKHEVKRCNESFKEGMNSNGWSTRNVCTNTHCASPNSFLS